MEALEIHPVLTRVVCLNQPHLKPWWITQGLASILQCFYNPHQPQVICADLSVPLPTARIIRIKGHASHALTDARTHAVNAHVQMGTYLTFDLPPKALKPARSSCHLVLSGVESVLHAQQNGVQTPNPPAFSLHLIQTQSHYSTHAGNMYRGRSENESLCKTTCNHTSTCPLVNNNNGAPKNGAPTNDTPKNDAIKIDASTNDTLKNNSHKNGVPKNDTPKNDDPQNTPLTNDSPQNTSPTNGAGPPADFFSPFPPLLVLGGSESLGGSRGDFSGAEAVTAIAEEEEEASSDEGEDGAEDDIHKVVLKRLHVDMTSLLADWERTRMGQRVLVVLIKPEAKYQAWQFLSAWILVETKPGDMSPISTLTRRKAVTRTKPTATTQPHSTATATATKAPLTPTTKTNATIKR